jgi:hypothetical protein
MWGKIQARLNDRNVALQGKDQAPAIYLEVVIPRARYWHKPWKGSRRERRVKTKLILFVVLSFLLGACTSLEPTEEEVIFDPSQPEPIEQDLGVSPGQADMAEFGLRAVKSG